jgi:hypothetical protein
MVRYIMRDSIVPSNALVLTGLATSGRHPLRIANPHDAPSLALMMGVINR